MADGPLVIGRGGVLVPPPAKAPARAPAKPAAKAPAGPNYQSALYQPQQVLTGQNLAQGAQSIADAQTKGPLSDLARQIAQNERQTSGAQSLTSGYFNQLLPYAQQSVTDQQAIGDKLASTLQGIGTNSQSAIGAAYAPSAQLTNLVAQGLGGGSDAMLAADKARASGTSASNAQTAQTFGAQTSANNSGLAASNLGAYALRGQERLGQIGQAGQLRNEPLAAKQASLTAQRGALYADALGKLRSGERSYLTTLAGLNLKTSSLQNTISNDQAKNQLTARGQSITAANNAANNATSRANNAATNATSAANNAANNLQRQLTRNAKGGTGARALTPNEQNRAYAQIDQIGTWLADARKQGVSDQQFVDKVTSGNNPAKRSFSRAQALAAIDAASRPGTITPATATLLYQMGLRGPHFKVQAPPSTTKGSGVPGIIGNPGSYNVPVIVPGH